MFMKEIYILMMDDSLLFYCYEMDFDHPERITKTLALRNQFLTIQLPVVCLIGDVSG